MGEANFVREDDRVLVTPSAAVGAGEILQLPDGRASRYPYTTAASSGTKIYCDPLKTISVPKTTGVVLLQGGRVYWDHSANTATYKRVGDRDFYLGRVVEDAGSTDATVNVALGIDPPYDRDLNTDTFLSAIVGTQALGGLEIYRRGAERGFVLSSTNEAQKLDLLGEEYWQAGSSAANAIIEFAFNVISDGAGTGPDINIGIANATHATDADSITEHMFLHLDGNTVDLRLQSKDGTTTVASTDTTIDYTEGSGIANRVEVWFDMRSPADVQVYINGANVLPATVFNVAAATGPWKLLAHVEKTASTNTYELALHWLRARFAEVRV